ncbi:MAG: ATP-dependent helicase HrpB [Candidatus Firestonebacteria bacterium]|nr:ATP-dependent helicase HrpB [Candidatus Firestonebacteria bacterium]
MSEEISRLPIYPCLDSLADTLAQQGLLLLSAETGAGKTTLFPWKLLAHTAFTPGKLLLLEPRRLAARAAAYRIASLLGEKVGQTVGLRTRQETQVSRETRLEVVTEGVLTRLLQNDPSLETYNTILFDEFHTRTLQGDLGLALAWEARKLFRPDLKIALLSATLPWEDIQKAFGNLPRVEVPGRAYPVSVAYCPAPSMFEKPWDAAARLSQAALAELKSQGAGTVLCFLPGYAEMHRAQELLAARLAHMRDKIFLLHGQMPAEKQREILEPGNALGLRVILATNVAETSLTIPGVKAVVDIGLERRVRFSPRTGMDHWETLPISQASAEQRKGRAGRLGPGQCYRWWSENEVREKFSTPEIAEADLAPLVLETALWGSLSPLDLTWLTPPGESALKRAKSLLTELALLDEFGKITPMGREAVKLTVHPRLAKMVLDAQKAGVLDTAAVMAALLENEDLLSVQDPDFRDRLTAFRDWARGENPKINTGAAKRVGEDARRILRALGKSPEAADKLDIDAEFTGELLLAAYPDRVAKRTRLDDPLTSRWLLASGRGAIVKGVFAREDFLAVADLDGGEQDARVFLAAPVSRRELEAGIAGKPREVWTLTWNGWKPKAKLELKVGALVLREQTGGVPALEVLQASALARLRNRGLAELPWSIAAKRFLARCRFVEKWGTRPGWPAWSDEKLLETATQWLLPYGRWNGSEVWDEAAVLAALEGYLGWERKRLLEELAPDSLTLPSKSTKKLDYETGEVPVLSARLQEFFGCRTTPKVCGQALLLDLLSPAGRTVQKTRDLDGFWDRAYPEIKKEFMGKYPRHPWPDDPRGSKPTARTKKRMDL